MKIAIVKYMLKDIIPFNRLWLDLHKNSFAAKSIVTFIEFIEYKLGAKFFYDQSNFSNEELNLVNLIEIAESLREKKIINSYSKNTTLCDEPKTIYWQSEYSLGNGKYEKAGGSSLDNSPLAFTKMLAETIERYTWFTYSNFLGTTATTEEMAKKNKNFINPNKVTGYTELQRKNNLKLKIDSKNIFHWVRGYSWTKKMPYWLPTQIITGHKDFRAFSFKSKETPLRESITTGLATHPVKYSALVSGALEVIERDAYMIMWLNQLSLPRIDLTELSTHNESLGKIITICQKYRLKPHAIRLLTDAPTYAICVVLEDLSESLPKFSIGLKAHQNCPIAVEGAILEALRAHASARKMILSSVKWDPLTKAEDIKHHDRLLYWSENGRSNKLFFLIQGSIVKIKEEIWDNDSDSEHFYRIVNWCKEKEYELVTINFNKSAANVPKWNIQLVVIPELQPIYFNEKLPQIGGERLRDIPKKYGYKFREPYCNDPHPFV